MFRTIVVAGATALMAAAVYLSMSTADAAGHCSIDPAFGSCADASG